MHEADLSFARERKDHEVYVPVHKTLLTVLREGLNPTGTKHGCELGECGTCTILVATGPHREAASEVGVETSEMRVSRGEPVLSCPSLPIELQNGEIMTIEGLADGATAHPLQTVFAELGSAKR